MFFEPSMLFIGGQLNKTSEIKLDPLIQFQKKENFYSVWG